MSTTSASTPPATSLRGISSMATKGLLDELSRMARQALGIGVHIESLGGVDAAKRVAAGEALDVVVLADDAIARLAAGGHVLAASRKPLVHSSVAIAVKAGAPRPDVSSEAALKAAVLAAPAIGYSTGPSGTELLKLFERWGIAGQLQDRLVQARPGVPVGSLLAQGQVALGFQQRSELMHLGGIDVIGPMPPQVPIVTTFTAAQASTSAQAAVVTRLLDWLASAETADAKRRHGMDPA